MGDARLMRRRARTFSLATLFLPRALRRDVQSMYAFYRMVDDLVDESDGEQAEILATLARWEAELRGEVPASSLPIVQVIRLAERYAIPLHTLLMMLDGARMDVAGAAIETMEDLRAYGVLVAGSVGMVLAHVLGANSPEALEAARELGVAMQLTNIARDVGEDLGRGRLYLPRTLLAAAGLRPADLARRSMDPAFPAVLRVVMAEARRSYAAGMAGIPLLPPRHRLAITIAADLYAAILTEIERAGYDVFRQRIHLSAFARWRRVMRNWWIRPTPDPRLHRSTPLTVPATSDSPHPDPADPGR